MLRYSLNRLSGIGEYIFQPSDNPDNGNQFESSDQQDYLAVNVYDTVTIENSIVNIFTPPNGYYDLPNYTKAGLRQRLSGRGSLTTGTTSITVMMKEGE